MSAVSGRTDILVTGYVLETNKPVEEGSKYKKAMQLKSGGKPCKLQVMTESEFLAIYPLTPEPPSLPLSTTLHVASERCATPVSSGVQEFDNNAREPLSKSLPMVHSGPSTVVLPQKPIITKQMKQPLAPSTSLFRESTLWTEKWRPTKSSEILGNAETVRKLSAWLRDWHSVCVLGVSKPVTKGRGSGRFGEVDRVGLLD